MGIDTSLDRIGDLYLLRKKTQFTSDIKPNLQLRGYDFISEKILSHEEIIEAPENCKAKILNYAINSPVII